MASASAASKKDIRKAASASAKTRAMKSELCRAPAGATIPLDFSWVDTCKVPSLEQYPRPLLVAHLCPGICGSMHAFNFLGVPESVRYLCDIWSALEQPLRFNVPPEDRVHIKCGKTNGGDVTAIDCISLDPVDIVTAGPPCPPWSSLGCGKTTEDPRAEVFNAVVECVIHWLHQPGARWVLKYSFWRMSWAFSNPGRLADPSCQSWCVISGRRCHGLSTAVK